MGVKYIITTVKDLYQDPLNFLLDSLIANGISEEDIFLSSQYTNTIYPNIEQIYNSRLDITLYSVSIPNKIYEYSFFIACQELLNAGLVRSDDLFFLIHDTSIIKINHISKIQDIIKNQSQYDIIYGNHSGQHNIGIYNYKSINIGYNIYKKINYISKQQAIDIEHNSLDRNYCIKKHTDKLKIFYPQINWISLNGIIVYYNNIPRVVSSLPFFDIEKYYFHAHNGYHPHNVF